MKTLVTNLISTLLIIIMFLVAVNVYADEDVKGFWSVVEGKINHCLVKQNKLICSEFPTKQFSDRLIIIKVKAGKNG